MSQLAIYHEEQPVSALTVEQPASEPTVYSFLDFAVRRDSRSGSDPAARAKIESQNQSCPLCCRSAVESIELRDGQFGRNGAMIPGTGTLVGFSCHSCGHEWPC